MEVKHTLRVIRAYAKLHVRTALEYRINFLVQAGLMAINNALYLLLFFLLFKEFGTINGYTFADVALVQGIAMIAIGLAHGCFGGCARISEAAHDGKLDLFLSQPFSALAHIGISRSAQDAWGDVAIGILIVGFLVPQSFAFACLCAIIGAVAFAALEIIVNSVGFLLARPKSLVRGLRYSVLAMSSWPMDVFPSLVRVFVYSTGIALVATVPRNIITAFSWSVFGIFIGATIVLLGIAILVFTLGVRRYESGNLVSMRG